MSRLPTLLMFSTTSGHYGCRTIYRATLDWLDRQLPLNQWGALVYSIKAKPGDEPIAEAMKADLERRGFTVEIAVAPWSRGQSHFAEYLKDQIRMSRHPAVADNPLVFWQDDDYACVTHRDPFPKVLYRMARMLAQDPELLTVRFLREQDEDALAPDRTVAILPEQDIAYSRHLNWQPLLLRSRDMYHACKVIEDNWAQASQMHGEALWRQVMETFSRSERRHAVWLKEHSVCANLGVPDYASVAARLNLTISPTV